MLCLCSHQIRIKLTKQTIAQTHYSFKVETEDFKSVVYNIIEGGLKKQKDTEE